MSFRRALLSQLEATTAGNRPWVSVSILAALFFAQSFYGSLNKSPTWDEPFHIGVGLATVETGRVYRVEDQAPLIREISGLFVSAAGIHWPSTPRANTIVGSTPMTSQTAIPMQYAEGVSIVGTNGPDRVMFWARLPMILLSTGLVFVMFVLGRAMSGNAGGVGAAFLYSFDPNIIAHSYLVTTDAGLAVFTMLFLLALWSYLQRPGLKRMVFCGLALGGALGSKYTGVILLPVSAVLLAAAAMWQPKSAARPGEAAAWWRSSRPIRYGLAWAGMCAAAILTLEYIYLVPSSLLRQYVDGMHMLDSADFHWFFMMGELAHRFYSYFVVAYLLKEPIAAMAAAVIGVSVWPWKEKTARLAGIFLLVPAAAILAAYTLFAKDLGVRYIIPSITCLHVFGGAGIMYMLGSRSRRSKALGIFLCAWLVTAAAGIYPDHLAYFNEGACWFDKPSWIGLDGGSRCGETWLDETNIDWGQGLKELKSWLDHNAPGQRIRLAYYGTFLPEYYGIDSVPIGADELLRGTSPGLYAVSANYVASLALRENRHDGQWLQQKEPVAIVGHAIYVFRVP